MRNYNIRYCKEVKPRYRQDYKGRPYIITKDKAQVDILKRTFKGRYTLTRPDRQTYKIILEEAYDE